jgi:hypothetical protein
VRRMRRGAVPLSRFGQRPASARATCPELPACDGSAASTVTRSG